MFILNDLHILAAGTKWVDRDGVVRTEAGRPVQGMCSDAGKRHWRPKGFWP